MKICKALSIAGSDSGGGAGIQADLKTFAAFAVHGMTAITAITAQNTKEVKGIHVLPPRMVELQIEAIVEDIGVDAAKTGMLYSREIVEVVAKKIDEYKIKTVVDPVMIAKSGAKLLLEDAMEALKSKLIPKAMVVTPNIPEAEVLVGYEIRSITEMKKAAEDIHNLGAEAVIIKGGHLTGKKMVDILYYKGKTYEISKTKIETKNTHGTGCSFSAAIAALIAKGAEIPTAFRVASEFMSKAIKYGYTVGRGHGPVNPLAELYDKSSKYEAWKNVAEAIKIIEESPELVKLIPEVRMNIGEASIYAEKIDDVCAVSGRITEVNGKLRAAGCPKFGSSKHVARTILTIMKYDPKIRAAMNIKYSKEAIEACKKLGLSIASFSRQMEPPNIKAIEGASLPWGIKEAIKNLGRVPDIIYDEGDLGKEPMIRILGKNAVEVALKAKKIGKIL
ncbi:MAG: bifunctional hydroxymethylpyrimidine kinase/phosphomethylpyrimidine kinase [archaeon GB-1867-005]|nr:bifunctional hydroxymethylpyrimidine kinase/phosphomethylpyrimidine kinase [Candidatus Culexmicrobium cathedralense]